MSYFEPQNVKTISGKYTVDQLMSMAPAGPDTLGYYATVTDLFGTVEDKMLCCQANGTYYWRPVRDQFAATASADQNTTLMTLKSPSILFLTGAILAGVGRTFTISPTYAYPGASFEIAFDGTLGLGSSLNIAGLTTGLVGMLLNSRRRFFYDGNAAAWKTFQ